MESSSSTGLANFEKLMYFIIRDSRSKLPSDPKVRKAAIDAWDKAQAMPLREAAKERRKIIKRLRFEKLAERPDLIEQSIEESKAIRRNMERRINEL